MIRKHLSWSRFILFFYYSYETSTLMDNSWIEIKKNAFNNIRRFGKSTLGLTFDSAFNVYPAFLHISSIWLSKFNLWSILVATWKSRHWQLSIGIGISIYIGVAKILVSAYEFFFEKVEHLCPIRLNILHCA